MNNQYTKGCRAIYEPAGAAREYAALALNIYMGCTHGCLYCFAPGALKKNRCVYFSAPSPRKNILPMVQHDAAKLSKRSDVPEILISFIGDPYQPAEHELGLTRQVLDILIEHDLPFTILTKGNPSRDFDILTGYRKARVGVTLTFSNQVDTCLWEPNAATFMERIDILQRAKDAGISTWVSMEPVIDPAQSLAIIDLCLPFVDEWHIGKLNHYKAREASIDWGGFVSEASRMLSLFDVKYTFKQSLKEFV